MNRGNWDFDGGIEMLSPLLGKTFVDVASYAVDKRGPGSILKSK